MKQSVNTVGKIKATQSVAWYDKHPVVSAILWILGTEIQQSPASGEDTKASTTLSWKDDHGGHIAEYIYQIQRRNDDNNISNDRTSVTHLEQRTLNHKFNSNSKDKEIEGEVIAPSPQWGFYVSITPPQESFPKVESTLKGPGTTRTS